ncbi:hypothetical protein J4050_01850 [Winogradskyella sp. DF17]|uniref:Uncharacterized protein n=1 Tax=Winogradskyella pelagia TaxID=2819984 RepID=A0ABS3SYB3_9FLAO|nr:hypothetical protein [Winogradskyella sp. DF17]MBO3115470.1 hypothetical protein [Winogradskyella sp. DF17]
MRNNILGGLIVFLAVVTCLILLDDITSSKDQQQITTEFSQDNAHTKDLASVEAEEK